MLVRERGYRLILKNGVNNEDMQTNADCKLQPRTH